MHAPIQRSLLVENDEDGKSISSVASIMSRGPGTPVRGSGFQNQGQGSIHSFNAIKSPQIQRIQRINNVMKHSASKNYEVN